MRKFLKFLKVVLVLGLVIGIPAAIAGLLLSVPERARPDQIAAGEPNIENGRLVFFAGGCASCHATPGQSDKLLLGGGVEVDSPAGVFVAPNISPHPERGIGAWTHEQFATAVLKGTSPDGQHYYPSFPYTTYQRMDPADLRDLFGFLRTLTPTDNITEQHDFPLELWPIRRGVGLWKRINLDGQALQPVAGESTDFNRGRYLVEALGHCAECHSPRDMTGAIVAARRHAGAPMPGGGKAPNITPGKGGIGDWTLEDFEFFLKDGVPPDDPDPVGGKMGKVIESVKQLPPDHIRAMAVYLKALKPIDN